MNQLSSCTVIIWRVHSTVCTPVQSAQEEPASKSVCKCNVIRRKKLCQVITNWVRSSSQVFDEANIESFVSTFS